MNSYKGGLIASIPQHKETNKTATKVSLWRAIIGGEGGGLNPVLLCANLHPHLPPRFTQLSWLFGSLGGLLAYKCVVTSNT